MRHCFELNKALMRLDSADQIARFVVENVCSFNAVNVATACHRIAMMQSQTRQQRCEMQSTSKQRDQGGDVRRMIPALLARASITVKSFKPQEVANLMWALATLGMDPGAELATVMSRRAVESAGEFKPQEVANLMWALATLGVDPGAELATAMSRRAVASAGEFKPQEVANLMWALAVLSCEDLACLHIWVHAHSLLIPVLCRNLGCFLGTDRAAVAAVLRQLHQTLLCVELEGLWPELNLAGLLGPDTMRLCRQAFEGAGVRASKLQVRPD